MSIEDIRNRARKFQRKIRRRNLREYIAAAIVLVFFTFQLIKTHGLAARTGFVLILAGTLYVVYQLYRKGSPLSAPAHAEPLAYLDFYRAELERQRHLLKSIWWWYLGPLLPGFAFLVITTAIAQPNFFIFAYMAFSAVSIAGIGYWNRRRARQLQGQIAELDALRSKS